MIAQGITFSKKQPTQVETQANSYDTDETVEQVERHDLVYERLCKPETPTPPEPGPENG